MVGTRAEPVNPVTTVEPSPEGSTPISCAVCAVIAYRLVLDTGANRSAITAHTAQLMGVLPSGDGSTVVTGFTGSARVPTIHVDHMEVGELLLGPTVLPILSDVFGGAQGVLGIEGLTGMRADADC